MFLEQMWRGVHRTTRPIGRHKLRATSVSSEVKVATETWIATALLHREHPERQDFTIAEIVVRAKHENIAGELRPGVRVHATLHCVANKAPNPARHRMLYSTGKHTRRLYRPGDPSHPGRAQGKIVQDVAEIPAKYRELLEWYEQEYVRKGRGRVEEDPILALRGTGKGLLGGQDPDEYLRSQRQGWE